MWTAPLMSSMIFLLTVLSHVVSAGPSVRSLGLCPDSDTGKFKCIDDTHFVICNGDNSIAQSMAPGAICDDGTKRQDITATTTTATASSSSQRPTTTTTTTPKLTTTQQSSSTVVTLSTSSTSNSSPTPTTVTTTTPQPPNTVITLSTSTTTAMPLSGDAIDPVHGGTYTFKTFNCFRQLSSKVLGVDLKGFLYCTDDTDYTICNSKESRIWTVKNGQKCQQQKDQNYAIVDA